MLPSTLQESSAMKKALLAKFKENVLSIPKSYVKLGKDDPRRITHSLKVALAITLVSVIYYEQHLYDRFGVNGIWAVVTVVVVFDFTAGATLSRGLNRGLATFLGGALGFGAVSLARRIGHICDTQPAECFHGQNKLAEGIVIGISVFVITFGSVCFESSKHGGTVEIKKDESFLQGYKSVLSSKGKEEMLANLARWEPRHGRFRLFYPWKQHLKIGGLARECASLIEAMHPYVDSDFQVVLHNL
ncbi:hypothetical protein SLEP1_g49269 [Rubroshorea leprosula]|uniref:Aluminum-activated malate transporter n=1 Tax=Rubroshorea leprosula TaxID=152421 RepID=A0AAV5LX85_9ROSI|nr:hypothetical protein SLEP1_g49269 [Rubroshorea leprosula]